MSTTTSTTKEIWVVPFHGQGHLLPSIELCKHIASSTTTTNFKTKLIISSNLSSSVPQSHQLFDVAELPSPPQPPQPPLPLQFEAGGAPPPPMHHMQEPQMAQDLENLIKSSGVPACAVVDVMMAWTREVFKKFGVLTVAFFTSGACSAALEYATWKSSVGDFNPGQVFMIPDMPEEMALTGSDFKKGANGPHGPMCPRAGPHNMAGPPPGGPPGGFSRLPPGPPGGGLGPRPFGPPPMFGAQPPWLEENEGSVAFMINTCDDLERPFIEYLAKELKKLVWGVGPLLPEQYWKLSGVVVHDHEIRANRQSNVTEDKVAAWLDSKPRGSVLYVAFGSEVSPQMEELQELAHALEASNRPFIWAIQPHSGRSGPPPHPHGGQFVSDHNKGYDPSGLDEKVGERGLIICGWAPQLLILSHPSTGGFLSHCGWNSTMEAIGRGVPLLTWPIRGDQHHNSKLVVSYLKVGCALSSDSSQIKKEDILNGIESLMGDKEVKNRAALLRSKFEQGFPTSSTNSLDAFGDFIVKESK